jgi:glycosyltransferase involved in cell wall biosynthesis
MNILALNPYHGGSHRAFLEGWQSRSQHTFETLSLPAYKWKWRMRHAAITFAEQVRELIKNGRTWDALFCTDMLNLAEFRGLAPQAVRDLPTVVYFHENQLTYPQRNDSDRDLHFAFTNITTALASDAVWFNSGFHRDTWLTAVDRLLQSMPDFQPVDTREVIRAKSDVQPQGIEKFSSPSDRRVGPLRLVWVARWEHDKNPEMFFEAIRLLATSDCDFRLSVLGESFANSPSCFTDARMEFAYHIDHWGFLESHAAYRDALADADVVVSTADHEFFGIAIVEAVAAGCFPLVPRRLAYPEVLGADDDFFHDDTPNGIAERLNNLADRLDNGVIWNGDRLLGVRQAERFDWSRRAAELDAACDSLVSSIGEETC